MKTMLTILLFAGSVMGQGGTDMVAVPLPFTVKTVCDTVVSDFQHWDKDNSVVEIFRTTITCHPETTWNSIRVDTEMTVIPKQLDPLELATLREMIRAWNRKRIPTWDSPIYNTVIFDPVTGEIWKTTRAGEK